jgi:hypothetical protein
MQALWEALHGGKINRRDFRMLLSPCFKLLRNYVQQVIQLQSGFCFPYQ